LGKSTKFNIVLMHALVTACSRKAKDNCLQEMLHPGVCLFSFQTIFKRV